MALKSFDDFVSRWAAGYGKWEPIRDEFTTLVGALGGNSFRMARLGYMAAMPTPLPTGVTGYIVTGASYEATTASATWLLAKLINLGSLNIATPSFTDGVAMPTVTEGGVSRSYASPVFIEVTTALNSAPGSITVTVVDQDGNAAETTAAQALTASSPLRQGGWIMLNGTDTGVRDITTATRTGGTTPSGVVQFWGFIPLVMGVLVGGAGEQPNVESGLLTGSNLVRLGAGDVLGVFLIAPATTNRGCMGGVTFIGE